MRRDRSEEHTSELQSPCNLVCRLLLEKKKKQKNTRDSYQVLVKPYAGHDAMLDICCHVDPLKLVLRLRLLLCVGLFFFFFNDTATTEIYTLSLHDALPI